MHPFSRILLPVDFSERSSGAARYARSLAARFHSEVVLLHVLTPAQVAAGAMDVGGSMMAELYRTRSVQVEAEFDRLVAGQLEGLKVRRMSVEGDPATKIVEIARHEAAGIIIMPTHGYGPFRRFLMGSNTAKVLHDAGCPVWTGVHLDQAPAEGIAFRQILCAADLGEESAKSLCWASRMARELGAGLTVVHATGAVPEADNAEEAPDASEASWQHGIHQSAETELRNLLDSVHAEASVIVEGGDPAKVICAAAERTGADLLVIGRGSAAGVFGHLRANAFAIIRMSPCPVVSV